MTFTNREDAGRSLAQALGGYRGADVVVLGLPRGGVPVAYLVAESIGAPLDVTVVRKLGLPHQPELAMGAVGEDGVRVLNEDVIAYSRVSPEELESVTEVERAEVARRARRFRGERPRVPLTGRTAIVVDDGVATGATARAACLIARAQGAGRVVLAVPVGSQRTLSALRAVADDVVCLSTPDPFWAVGQGYRDFDQVPDAEVVRLLDAAHDRWAGATASGPAEAREPVDLEVEVPVDGTRLAGQLSVPTAASGLVIFAHGSGSSRHSPRNRWVAKVLGDAGLATLLFDLLTPLEERDRALVFDIALLGGRLVEVTDWARRRPGWAQVPVGYFGASTGAAAALWAAADPRTEPAAVVSRGGRPDLAADRLPLVRTPTLLIVGGNDPVVLELNRQAQSLLHAVSRLAVVPGATHLFEEPGTLDQVALLARDWFVEHLAGARAPQIPLR